MYARLRNEAPVFRSQTGEYIISKYRDVKSVLKSSDYRTGNRLEWLSRSIDYFKNHDEDLGHIYKAVNSFILFLNPPDHQAIRSFVAKTWDDRQLETMIREVVDEHLHRLSGSFDVVKDYAQPVPSSIICRILGIPTEEFQNLRALGTNMVRALDLYQSFKDLVELNDTSKTFVNYFGELIRRKRQHPDNGLLSKIISANEASRLLNEEQLVSISIFLYVAGLETTAASIGTGLHDLIERPKSYQALRSENKLLETSGTDELFRFNGPVHLLGRIATKDVQVDGINIPANSTLTLVIASANRDPEQFMNANDLDLHRAPNQHLGFGYGTHFCLGEWLGKLQTRIAVQRFIERFPKATVETHEIEWMKNIAVRGMTSLLVNTR